MTSQPVFVRLVEGRLWHLQGGKLLTACGRQVEGDREPERLVGAVPSGAWVCTRCRATLADWLAAVDQAIKADPRGRRTEPLPEVSEELASLAEEVRVSRETPTPGPAEAVDLVAALKESIEAARRTEAMGGAS